MKPARIPAMPVPRCSRFAGKTKPKAKARRSPIVEKRAPVRSLQNTAEEEGYERPEKDLLQARKWHSPAHQEIVR